MKRALIIDVQNTDKTNFPHEDRRFYMRRWLSRGTPVHIALTPYQRDQWKDLKSEIHALVERPGSGLLLEGLLHVCSHRNHTVRDPHHQDLCSSLTQSAASFEQQFNNIEEGAEFLQQAIGVRPVGYVPPQHLWNRDTRDAVEALGMKYLVTNAHITNLDPYADGGVLIVPSGSVKRRRIDNQVVHVYYDRINGNHHEMFHIEDETIPLSEVEVGEKTYVHMINEGAMRIGKQWRDIKRFGRWWVKGKLGPSTDEIRAQRQADYNRHVKELYG